MGAICGWAGNGHSFETEQMLSPLLLSHDQIVSVSKDEFSIALNPTKKNAPALDIQQDENHVSAILGSVTHPIDYKCASLKPSPVTIADSIDGSFAMAHWDELSKSLTLMRDPFGFHSLFYAIVDDTFYFSSEIKQLLALHKIAREIDYTAIHHYLTFSFIPADRTPVQSVKQLPPGCYAVWKNGTLTIQRYFTPHQCCRSYNIEHMTNGDSFLRCLRKAVERRADGSNEVALNLSGGLDSSTIGALLKSNGSKVHAFTLDFGKHSVEKEEAKSVAHALDIPLNEVSVTPKMLRKALYDYVWKLDLPYGDAAAAPQYFLSRFIRGHGLNTVFNGEGGDQLLGGWTQKPMLSAAIYSPGLDLTSQYLNCFRRFSGRENELYSKHFQEQLGDDTRSALISDCIEGSNKLSYLDQVRLIDFGLKGTQNIAPRAHRMASAWDLDMKSPFFDRELTNLSFSLPPQLKLSGACEKYILKKHVSSLLPEHIVWRKKVGMGVPITEWVLKSFKPVTRDFFSKAAIERRGLFQREYILRLLKGDDHSSEIRQRRVGEKLWSLIVLEAWCRRFLDR